MLVSEGYFWQHIVDKNICMEIFGKAVCIIVPLVLSLYIYIHTLIDRE